MTIELGETLVTGENNVKKDMKPLKAFNKLSTMAPGTVIEGIHQGRFESKNRPGSFFHVFLAKDGEGYGYGDNAVLSEKIEFAKTQAKEHGLTDKQVYMQITFNGKVTGKSGRGYYSFSNPTIIKANVADDTITSADVPF